jgi:hypothetical protein
LNLLLLYHTKHQFSSSFSDNDLNAIPSKAIYANTVVTTSQQQQQQQQDDVVDDDDDDDDDDFPSWKRVKRIDSTESTRPVVTFLRDGSFSEIRSNFSHSTFL